MEGSDMRWSVTIASFLVLGGLFSVFAQDEPRASTMNAKLDGLSRAFDREYRTEHARAVSVAAGRGWPVHREDPGARVIALQRLAANGMPLYYCTHNLNAAKTVSTNRVWPGGSAGLNLSGSGMRVGEWDAGEPRTTHQELTGRVSFEMGEFSYHHHSTHVAGTLIASGVSAGAKGMAFQARLNGWDWENDFSEMAAAAASGLLLSNHSYGYMRGWDYDSFGDGRWAWWGDITVNPVEDYRFGFYDNASRNIDSIAILAPYYLIVYSAGNDRDDNGPPGGTQYWLYQGGSWVLSTAARNVDGQYDCISHMSLAKNCLTVGAVSDIPGGYGVPGDVVMSTFSSWGPTDDGRIKPDIVANGIDLVSCVAYNDTSYRPFSGTSMAAPNATGSLLLLQRHYKDLHGGDSMRAATLKALAIHTADEAGSADGPDYSFGWGLMNTQKAAAVISNADNRHIIKEASIANGRTYALHVQSDGTGPLTATICWTDRPGTPVAPAVDPRTRMLVNDLDLRVVGAGSTHQPWRLDPLNVTAPATRGDDTVNTVEKVLVSSPVAGAYVVQVTHKRSLQGGSQDFALIVSGASQLSEVNLPVCTASSGQMTEHAAADGTGGVIVAWEDYRWGNYDIYAQRINASGAAQWTTNGAPLCLHEAGQRHPEIIADGTGGAIVTWYEDRFLINSMDVYAQRINPSGTTLWTLNGVGVSVRTGRQQYPQIASDGSSGAIIVWEDDRVYEDWDVYVQRVNSSGTVQWSPNGNGVCAMTGSNQKSPRIVRDGAGGAIVAWLDTRNSTYGDVYAHRVRSDGTLHPLWPGTGAPISTSSSAESDLAIIPDGTGGAIIAWTLVNPSSPHPMSLYAQRINSGGTVQWAVNGIQVGSAEASVRPFAVAEDGSGGALFVWVSQPGGPTSLVAQRVSSTGGLLWPGGRTICWDNLASPDNPGIVGDGAGGALIVWEDNRNGNLDIYAQHVNAMGSLEWYASGMAISTPPFDQSLPAIAEHGTGDALAVWMDYRSGLAPDLYGQHITGSGGLPVQLANFTARFVPRPCHVFLEWTTLSEVNNYGFVVQRREEGMQIFADLRRGFVPGHGTTNIPQYYSFADSSVTGGEWWYRLRQIDLDGTVHFTDPISVAVPTSIETGTSPGAFSLSQNYPNPFNPTTHIRFSIGEFGVVSLKVYDLLGREVAVLVDERRNPGSYSVAWDGSGCASGVYVFRITCGGFVGTGKMILVR